MASRRRVRYYFGRFNLVAQYADKEEFIATGLHSRAVLEKRGLKWQFLRVENLQVSLGRFLTGYLAKYKPLTEEEVAVPAAQDLDDQLIENRVIAKARFFLHIGSGLIAYHPVGSHITRDQLRNRFAELFEASKGDFFVSAEIQSIQEEEKVWEGIQALSMIRSVKIYLHPSNPSLRDVWKRTDLRLKELHAAEYQEHFQSDQSKGGLKIEGDPDINAKIAMAQDGYGKVLVSGLKDGEEMTVSTEDNPVNALASPDEVSPSEVLDALDKLFRKILARLTQ